MDCFLTFGTKFEDKNLRIKIWRLVINCNKQTENVVIVVTITGEMIKLPYILQFKWKFREYQAFFDSKHWLFLVLLLSLRSPIYDVHIEWPTNEPFTSTIHKNEQIYCLKRVESTNTWQILRTLHPPTPFCLDVINVCSPSITCLNANEILNFMKIHLSYFC